jgi:hypothetical protein
MSILRRLDKECLKDSSGNSKKVPRHRTSERMGIKKQAIAAYVTDFLCSP